MSIRNSSSSRKEEREEEEGEEEDDRQKNRMTKKASEAHQKENLKVCVDDSNGVLVVLSCCG